MEQCMLHFYTRGMMHKRMDGNKALIDADLRQAADIGAMVVPFRHARLSAMKLAGNSFPLPIRHRSHVAPCS
jgi:hypothetical protein